MCRAMQLLQFLLTPPIASSSVTNMTRIELENWARSLWADALRADPTHAVDVALAVVGAEVWCWSALSSAQLRALSRGLFSAARLAS